GFLLDVELLELDLLIVERSAEHDRFGGAIAPGETGHFSPKRGGYVSRMCQISAKSKIGGANQTAEAIGQSNRFRRLGQRNVGGSASDLPVVAGRMPFMSNVAANFSTEDIGIEL